MGASVEKGGAIAFETQADRHLYLVSSGKVRVNGIEANARDGVAITGEAQLRIEADEDAELVLVDAR
jgi:redox-sensitive bicupin YhaK (pirin superfamily)